MPILQLLLHTPWYLTLLALTLASGAAVFWWLFFKQRSPEFTTKDRSIFMLFIVGLVIVIPLGLVESSVVERLPIAFRNVILGGTVTPTPEHALLIATVMFLVAAPLEELSKFFFLKWIMPHSEINQIIDSVKFGIAIGIGFAIVENALFLLAPLNERNWTLLAATYFLRFFFSALAHGVYSGIAGYYIGLAKHEELHRKKRLGQAIIFPILLHGAFNTLLLLSLGYYALPLLLIFFGLLLRWYQARANQTIFAQITQKQTLTH